MTPTVSDHDEQANGGLRFDPEAIDPGGPIDPAIPGPQPVDEVSRPAAFTLMAPGWYPPEHAITQAYGFCFTDGGLVAFVHTHDGFRNLPGGQLEPGETASDALVREVAEEACARVTACHYLTCQHVWDPQAPDGPASHYQTRWWARIALDPWRPDHETPGNSSHPATSSPPCRGAANRSPGDSLTPGHRVRSPSGCRHLSAIRGAKWVPWDASRWSVGP
jgi:ADP-ribose pyrophosphatase YjhB (NUDIX family)